jgi:hypothetical protein
LIQARPSVEATLTAKLQQDPSNDHIATLDCSIAHVAVQAKANTGSQATIVTFGTDAEMVKEIKNGDVAWANDQQPFLQGHLAVDSLWLSIPDCRFGYLGRDPVRHAAIDWAAIGYGFHTARMESTAAMAGVFCYRLRSAYPRVPSCRPGWLRRK